MPTWTWGMVEERLIEAMALWRRAPDRERGWLHVKAYWPEMRRHNAFGDYSDDEGEPRPLPLTRRQIAEMTQAGDWLGLVPERDRRLVVLALGCLAAGEARVPWLALRARMGVRYGADGLRKRYSRAIQRIAETLNGAEIRAESVSTEIVTQGCK